MNELTGTSLFQDLSIANKSEGKNKESNELGQKAFLKLMITQMENQNPLDPQENTEFISQLAQFSSVESLDKLNNNFDSFTSQFVANQALQASSLVGQSVSVPSEKTLLEPGGIVTAFVEIPSYTSDLNVDIYDGAGSLVDSIPVGEHPEGDFTMRWDGKFVEINGETADWQSSHAEGLPPGEYKFQVTSTVDGEVNQLETNLSANVNSVTVGNNGSLTLNLAGIGSVSLADVKQFNE